MFWYACTHSQGRYLVHLPLDHSLIPTKATSDMVAGCATPWALGGRVSRSGRISGQHWSGVTHPLSRGEDDLTASKRFWGDTSRLLGSDASWCTKTTKGFPPSSTQWLQHPIRWCWSCNRHTSSFRQSISTSRCSGSLLQWTATSTPLSTLGTPVRGQVSFRFLSTILYHSKLLPAVLFQWSLNYIRPVQLRQMETQIWEHSTNSHARLLSAQFDILLLFLRKTELTALRAFW